MAFTLKTMLRRGPEPIELEKVFVREIPLTELGLTVAYILMAGLWTVFSDEILYRLMAVPMDSPGLQTMKGVNFTLTTALVLYLVLRRTFRASRQAQEALRQSQERFEGVALATTDAICDLNVDTQVAWWSDGVQKLFGYSPAEVSSQPGWWLARLHAEDKERVLETIRRALEGGANMWSGEYRFQRRDGTYALVQDRGYILKDAAGKPVRIVGGISDISERRQAQEALEVSRLQLRALTSRLQSGLEEERSRVAREIHDELGQVLTALKLNLDWLERHVGAREDDPPVNAWLERVVESGALADSAIESVQRIATDLRPALLDNLGLPEALQEESARFEKRSGIHCRLQLPAAPVKLPREIATAVFRVFQEALTNVARHARATEVSVSLATNGDGVTLCLEDNGCGINPKALGNSSSLGLIGMRERAFGLGGEVAVAPITPHGTRVKLWLPTAADSPEVKILESSV